MIWSNCISLKEIPNVDTNTLCYDLILQKKKLWFYQKVIINMLEFSIDNIFVLFSGCVFQLTVGIPMGTSCAPFLADVFLYSYEAGFIQRLLKKNEKKPARSSNFTFRYIDDVLSLNNSRFSDFVNRIYPNEPSL